MTKGIAGWQGKDRLGDSIWTGSTDFNKLIFVGIFLQSQGGKHVLTLQGILPFLLEQKVVDIDTQCFQAVLDACCQAGNE